MMKAFEFVCIFYQIQKKYKVHLEPDIIKYIYLQYHSLLEILDILDKHHVKIAGKRNEGPMIKDNLIHFILKNKIQYVFQNTYNYNQPELKIEKSKLVYINSQTNFQFQNGDTIIIYGIRYVMSIKCTFILLTSNSNHIYLNISKFVKMIDEAHVAILFDHCRSKYCFQTWFNSVCKKPSNISII